MIRIRLLFALAVALMMLSATAAYAGPPDRLLYQWSESDFDPPGLSQHWTYTKHNLDFDGQTAYDWEDEVGNPAVAYDQNGILDVDPILNQTIRNFTPDPWTDWHVSITNGYIEVDSADVHNLDPADPPWVVEYDGLFDGDTKATSFFAHVVTGMDTQVDPFEQLLVHFVYNPNQLGDQVSIKQYPTAEWVIPEPGSIVALLAGLAGLGLGAIRRRAS